MSKYLCFCGRTIKHKKKADIYLSLFKDLEPQNIYPDVEENLYMEWLTDERKKWRSEIEQGIWHEPYVLQQYKEHRNSNLWRSTREVEKLCEYVLYLEDCLKKKIN